MRHCISSLERGVLMGHKTKEQLLEELTEVQKMLEKRTEAHGQMIKKLQTLVANEGLFSQIIDFFPYPMVLFTPQYTLAMGNKAFAGIANLPAETAAILRYQIDDARLSAAVAQVFTGETFFLEDVQNPFSMFPEIRKPPDHFHKAVVFPVPALDTKITHGAIVFLP
jgi:hypothetical protein